MSPTISIPGATKTRPWLEERERAVSSSSSSLKSRIHQHQQHQHPQAEEEDELEDELMSETINNEDDNEGAGANGTKGSELDNFIHPQWESISTSSSKATPTTTRKPRAKPSATRQPGQSLIPLTKVESIVQSDPDNGALSKEAIFAVAVATEEFLGNLGSAAYTRARLDSRSLPTYADLADAVFYFEEYNFLQDMIPRSTTIGMALRRRAAKLNGVEFDSDSEAIAAATERPRNTGTKSSSSKGKEKTANGHAYSNNNTSNGDVSTPASTQETPSKRARFNNNLDQGVHGTGSVKVESVNSEPSGSRSRTKKSRGMGALSASAPAAATMKKTSARVSSRTKPANATVSTGSKGSGGSTSATPAPAPAPTATATTAAVSGGSGSMKIKIRPRNITNPTAYVSSSSTDRPDMLTLNSSSTTPSSETNGAATKVNGASQGKGNSGNGVVFAPTGALEAPLWTRVPLPPPPTPRGRADAGSTNSGTHGKGAAQKRHVSHTHTVHGTQATAAAMRDGSAEEPAPDFRGAISPSMPNPGRTIYSQQR